ncbi:LVIVD repeat-containing protein [Candidatus Palauibacter sp.]|uniref:LVIVD repeat-containing protein n=2 Tax=Candidatus Palauibacter sp. TaxID=3101350 RepID=UPI003AF27C04
MIPVTKGQVRMQFSERFRTLLACVVAAGGLAGCAAYRSAESGMGPAPAAASPAMVGLRANPPTPDPRVGLAPGLFDAGEAAWNLRLVSATPPTEPFVGKTNSDLAFTGPYAIQGNYDGIQIWDISDPANPESVITYVCPASQSDVSVYEHLLFVSGEGFGGRLDCGEQGVQEEVSHDRLRGIRIFDISDITAPEYVANVQTCRGSHTHTVLEHPGDDENVYIYVSGSAPVRPADELAGCSAAPPNEDPNSALFRIEVIRVPLADPASAAVVSSPRIFEDLVAPPRHGPTAEERAEMEEARAQGAFFVEVMGQQMALPPQFATMMLDSMVTLRGGEGAPTAQDTAALTEFVNEMIAEQMAGIDPNAGPTQCHDITVYPAIGLAGGACEGYGLLIDISDPENPRRLAAVADSNFSYWHSATFNNDGSAILFTDEWGGGGSPKCRASDPMEWGANAIFTIEGTEMDFQSYFKLPAPQTPEENCVAHNGSLIPIPGRDIMIQGWYQGGISLIDWTDPANPVEIAYFDRGPVNPDRMQMGGSWSVYWYNGVIVNSEIARGLDIFELAPSELMTQNEIDAANSVQLTHLNSQGQPIFEWPATFALAHAYLDQLERHRGLSAARIGAIREELAGAEEVTGSARSGALRSLSEAVGRDAAGSGDAARVRMLADAVRALADAGM